jgi:hypothetical protein
MYAFAPLALAALHKVDADRPRSYRVPAPGIVLPAAFCSANLIIYWGGFQTTWILACAMVAGLILFGIGAWRARTGAYRTLANAVWMLPWFAGHVLVGYLGRYGGGRNILPNWIDIAIVIAFALAIFYWARGLALTSSLTAAAVAKDSRQLAV